MSAHVVGDTAGIVHALNVDVRPVVPCGPEGGELGELHRRLVPHRSDQGMEVDHAARLWTMGPSDLHVRAVEVFREIPRPLPKELMPFRFGHGAGESQRAEASPRGPLLDKLRGHASECPSR